MSELKFLLTQTVEKMHSKIFACAQSDKITKVKVVKRKDPTDDTLTDEAENSTASNEQLRFMVLGSDDALMDKACATILGERENRDAFQFGEWKPRMAQVCGRQVSVLKTPSYWLEHLKSYFFYNKGVKSLKHDLKFFESMMFPGPHAFLLVDRDVKSSGSQYYLLHALSDVLGEEVLNFCMVLFIDEARHNDPKKNTCFKMCRNRHHILQNTYERKQKSMAQWNSNSFFTNHLECFKKSKIYFEADYCKTENKLRKKLNDSKDREREIKDDNEKLQRQLKQLTENEKQLENKRTETTVKEDSLHERPRCLDKGEEKQGDRERLLDERLELEMREKELTQRDARSSEHHQTTSATAGAELKSIDISQASGSLEIQKSVRRNSMDFNPPYMSQDIDCDKDQKFIPKTFDKL